MNKIWVFRPGALGDTILTFPFLERLQNKYIDDAIVFWGNPDYTVMAQEFFSKIKFKSFEDRYLMPLFSCDFSKSDLSIDLPFKVFVILKKDKLLENNLKMICENISWCEIQEKNNVWVAEQMSSMISDISSNLLTYIRPTPEKSKILIHMGTGSKAKLLPLEFWQSLIGQLKLRFSITLLYGPAEKNLNAGDFDGIDCIRNISINDLMKQMQEFRYYIGLDSGVSHLAGVMGLKGLALFHHTNPDYWRPQGLIKSVEINSADPHSWKLVLDHFPPY